MAKGKRTLAIGDDKRENFKGFAAARTDRVLVALRVLANCGNRATYEPTDAEIAEIEAAIAREAAATIAALRAGKKGGRVVFAFKK